MNKTKITSTLLAAMIIITTSTPIFAGNGDGGVIDNPVSGVTPNEQGGICKVCNLLSVPLVI